MVLLRGRVETYIDRCADTDAYARRPYQNCPPQPLVSANQGAGQQFNNKSFPSSSGFTKMRSSMIYPNVITAYAPGSLASFDTSQRDGKTTDHSSRSKYSSSSDEERYSSRHSRSSRRPARSPSPPRQYNKNVRFFDESPPPRYRRSNVPERPKSYARDTPPIAINESAKDTSRRLFRQAQVERDFDPYASRGRERPKYHRRDSAREILTTVAEKGTEVALPPAPYPEPSRRESRRHGHSHGHSSRRHGTR